jgi:DNA-binding NarL/FixJ family response regulator
VTFLQVFIAEDSPSVLNALTILLAGVPHVQIVGHADRAQQAAQLIASLRPDVALLDVSLAEGTGIQVLQQIKQTSPGVVAVVLTSYDDRWTRAKCKEAGADHFLNKSADFDKIPDLLQRIAHEKGIRNP